MSMNLSTHDIIVSALKLPLAAREEVINALQDSMIDDSIEHPPAGEEDDAAWGEEIARRIADIESGRVKTIPSEEAWKIINCQAPPKV
jgi:putative addiction module component (TIGR02574 family)